MGGLGGVWQGGLDGGRAGRHWMGGRVFFFFYLRPKSTAMVIAGRSVDLTTLFPGQA